MELRPYQVETVNWLNEHQRSILGTSPGLGKTACVLRARSNGPTLVVCALREALFTWEREIPKWTDASFLLYAGTPKQREKLCANLKEYDYIVTTPAMLPEVGPVWKQWGRVVVDEAHIIRGRNTIAVKNLRKVKSSSFFWVTGSPLVNSPADLWVPLNIIDREQFGSYWKWVFENCIVVNEGFGNKVLGVANKQKTREVLRPYYYAVLKSEVQDQLPPKNRYAIVADLTPSQRKLYGQMEAEMIGYLSGGELLLSPNVLSVGTRLRQLLISPELLPGWNGPAESSALSLLHDRVQEDFDNGDNVVVFTPFAEAIPIIARHIPSCNTFTFQGGLSQAREFQAADGPKALIGTIRAAASFDAYAANVAYFMGFDWTPAFNEQAEDRIHRIGQTKSVDIRYVVCRDTISERIVEVLNEKKSWQDILPRRQS